MNFILASIENQTVVFKNRLYSGTIGDSGHQSMPTVKYNEIE